MRELMAGNRSGHPAHSNEPKLATLPLAAFHCLDRRRGWLLLIGVCLWTVPLLNRLFTAFAD